MDAFDEKKNGSAGRARGHSMLSFLKSVKQEQNDGEHPGISFKRLHPQDIGKAGVSAASVRPSIVNATGRVVSDSHVSALTVALQGTGK